MIFFSYSGTVLCKIFLVVECSLSSMQLNIYILGEFTKKPYSKPLESHIVYIQITTSSHTTSMTSK